MTNIAISGVSTCPFSGLAMIRCLATLSQLVKGLVHQISNLLLGNNLLLMRSLCVHLQGKLDDESWLSQVDAMYLHCGNGLFDSTEASGMQQLGTSEIYNRGKR